jgi:hypothetical protein
MKHMLLIYTNTANPPQYTPEQQRTASQAWIDFQKEAEAAGVLVSNAGLRPVSDATTPDRFLAGQCLWLSDRQLEKGADCVPGIYNDTRRT